mmetsp:Transcript_10531/g.30065  ORF Transcript_10531/g.30065 Transcript_10531/m.30065 type:complete len:260 (+) Transcript_10531:143-922(+)
MTKSGRRAALQPHAAGMQWAGAGSDLRPTRRPAGRAGATCAGERARAVGDLGGVAENNAKSGFAGLAWLRELRRRRHAAGDEGVSPGARSKPEAMPRRHGPGRSALAAFPYLQRAAAEVKTASPTARLKAFGEAPESVGLTAGCSAPESHCGYEPTGRAEVKRPYRGLASGSGTNSSQPVAAKNLRARSMLTPRTKLYAVPPHAWLSNAWMPTELASHTAMKPQSPLELSSIAQHRESSPPWTKRISSILFGSVHSWSV